MERKIDQLLARSNFVVNSQNSREKEKVSKAMQIALQWLQDHPEHLDTPCRKLAETIGVNYKTINQAQRYIKKEGKG